MQQKMLIANRGEIACRIMKTAQGLGIPCIAVYSEVDENALHVSMANEAYYLGPAPTSESYLNQEKIIEIAKKANATLIHPGYGFLSENSEFAERCLAHNLIFIGPSPTAIHLMGSKSQAKKIMEQSSVPLLPGYHGDNQDSQFLQSMAEKIGYPILLKASAGGGGKGMRIVRQSDEFEAALAATKREAEKSFGDSHIIIEKYLDEPRHIEIQVLADQFGHTLYLFERDCSIQRRHQKVIEEAPALGVSNQLREKMGQTAIEAAKAIHYVGAGTIEFLVDKAQQFYFMEMNTRLQVEHPITEMITGLDLVEWQIRIALGEHLTLTQNELTINGHAFEVRLYAEEPNNHFLPSIGTIIHCHMPEPSRHVRIESGIKQGDSISPYYDPMIAKLVVWDTTRALALSRLQSALNECRLVGPATNIQFLKQIVKNPDYQAGVINTHFIDNHQALLLAEPTEDKLTLLALATLYQLLKQSNSNSFQQNNEDIYSPWHQRAGWRLNFNYKQSLQFIFQNTLNEVLVDYLPNQHYQLTLQDKTLKVHGKLINSTRLEVFIDGKKWSVDAVEQTNKLTIIGSNLYGIVFSQTSLTTSSTHSHHQNQLLAPMPGIIVNVLVKEKQTVKKGNPLIIMEAMKMEHTISAPTDGTIDTLFYQPGDMVNEGVELLKFVSNK